MNEKVLFVDDDIRILKAFARHLEGEIDFETSACPQAALELIKNSGPFAVVVTDMRMPGMTGVELLEHVRKIAPDTVRIILSGHADLATSQAAINERHIFRLLSKPCSQDRLAEAVSEGIRHYNKTHENKSIDEAVGFTRANWRG